MNGRVSSALCDTNYECAASGLNNIVSDDRQAINFQDALDLHKQPVKQPEVAVGDAGD